MIFGGRESWIVFSAFCFNKIKRKSYILENKRVKLPELAKLFVGSLKLAVYVVVIKFWAVFATVALVLVLTKYE